MTESIKCPYCGTEAKMDIHNRRCACECRRMHEYPDFHGKTYWVLYHKGKKKEVIKVPDDEKTCAEIIQSYNEMRYNAFKEKYEKHE